MTFNIKDGLTALVSGSPLTREQSQSVMKDIMSGNANDAQIAGFLTALRIRGETPEIIAGCASIMREFAASINPISNNKHLVDTCGTGGDKSNTFNISTVAALITAGAGAVIAKHGNRSVSSSCGSADLLEGLGYYVVSINIFYDLNKFSQGSNEIILDMVRNKIPRNVFESIFIDGKIGEQRFLWSRGRRDFIPRRKNEMSSGDGRREFIPKRKSEISSGDSGSSEIRRGSFSRL